MAANTVVHDVGVVKIGRSPGNGCVAVVAVIATRDMCGMFASSGRAIVAGTARSNNLSVIHGECRNPGIRRVAVLANIGGLNVRCVFTGRIGTIVAAKTVTRNIYVIKVCGEPADGGMTVLAVVATTYVIRRFSGRCHTIVTRTTGTNHLCMVDGESRHPYVWSMTVLANIGRLYMVWMLAGRFDAVVAA